MSVSPELAEDKREEDRKFQEVMNALHTREQSTLVFATVASSASLILLGIANVPPQELEVLKWAGFVFPILGFVFRELTIFGIDRADYRDLSTLLVGQNLSRSGRQVAWFNHFRRFIFRSLLLIPSLLWWLRITSNYRSNCVWTSVTVVLLLGIVFGVLEWTTKKELGKSVQ